MFILSSNRFCENYVSYSIVYSSSVLQITSPALRATSPMRRGIYKTSTRSFRIKLASWPAQMATLGAMRPRPGLAFLVWSPQM